VHDRPWHRSKSDGGFGAGPGLARSVPRQSIDSGFESSSRLTMPSVGGGSARPRVGPVRTMACRGTRRPRFCHDQRSNRSEVTRPDGPGRAGLTSGLIRRRTTTYAIRSTQPGLHLSNLYEHHQCDHCGLGKRVGLTPSRVRIPHPPPRSTAQRQSDHLSGWRVPGA
jgi:hypothetical protein